MRRGIEEAFAGEGVLVRCTGYGNQTIPGSSVGMVHFPLEPDTVLDCPDAVWNPGVCDVVRREQVLKLALLLNRVHVVHGLGALSTEHTDEDLDHLFQACSSAARRLLGLDT